MAKAKPMTKTQLIATLAEQNEMTKKQAAGVLETFTGIAYEEAKKASPSRESENS